MSIWERKKKKNYKCLESLISQVQKREYTIHQEKRESYQKSTKERRLHKKGRKLRYFEKGGKEQNGSMEIWIIEGSQSCHITLIDEFDETFRLKEII